MMLVDTHQPRADALVLFGATGDLAKRKLFPALYQLERTGQLDMPVIGVARSDCSDQAFCEHARDAIIADDPHADAAVIDPLMKRLDLIQGDYSDPATWESLRDTLIVMLTAKGRDTDVAKGLALGANAYVTKPFSTRDLVAQVRSLLDARA